MCGVGNSLFSPKGAYTREQSIATMLRLYDFSSVYGQTPDSLFLNPNDMSGGSISRQQWISQLIERAKLSMDNNVEVPSYSDVDKDNPYAWAIETALQNGVIPISESENNRFFPQLAATEAFAVISAVRALGFLYESLSDVFAIANDCGIFSGIPTAQNLTSNQATAILISVSRISAPVSIDPNVKQIVDFSDDLINLFNNDISYKFYKKNGKSYVELLISDAVGLETGDNVLLPPSEEYPGGLVQKIVSKTLSGDIAILETVDPPLEEILGDEGIDIQGAYEAKLDNFVINPELADEIKAETGENWIIETAYGDEDSRIMVAVTGENGLQQPQLLADSPANFSLSIKATTEYIKVGISEPRPIGSSGFNSAVFVDAKIYYPKLISKVDLKKGWLGIPVGVREIYVAVETRAEISGGIQVTTPKDWKIKIGEIFVPLGQPFVTVTVNIYLELKATGKFEITYEFSNTNGVQYINNQLRMIKQATDKPATCKLEGEVELGIRPQPVFTLTGLPLFDLDLRTGVGANASFPLRLDDPKCLDVSLYWYLKLSGFKDGIVSDLIKSLRFDIEIFGKNNSPLKKKWHYEGNGSLIPLGLTRVDSCTYNTQSAHLDGREELLGEWVGTYYLSGNYTNVGTNGLSISVYEDGGYYRALVSFFPIEGSPPSQRSGSWYADVSFNEANEEFDLVATVWKDRPQQQGVTWGWFNFSGIINGDIFSSTQRSDVPFSVRRNN